MLLATWFLVCFFKRFRSFNAENLGSEGQRAANFENDSTPGELESGPTGSSGAELGGRLFLETSNFNSW